MNIDIDLIHHGRYVLEAALHIGSLIIRCLKLRHSVASLDSLGSWGEKATICAAFDSIAFES